MKAPNTTQPKPSNQLRGALVVSGLALTTAGFLGLSAPAAELVSAGDCTGELAVNGGFEQPSVEESSFEALDAAEVPGWQTTAEDSLIELWSTGFRDVEAAAGLQFAELNATGPTSLYQIFDSVPGTTLRWEMSHRGREGVDTLSISFGAGLDDRMGGPAAFSAGPDAWSQHEGAYVVPEGQTQTTVLISSVASSGEPGSGNLIDQFRIHVDENCSGGELDAVDDSFSISEGSENRVDLAANDTLPQGADVAYSVESQPSQAVASVELNGLLTLDFIPGAVGTDQLTYEVCDSRSGRCDTATLAIEIVWVNRPPIARDDRISDIGPGQSFGADVTVNDFDPDGEPLDISSLRVVDGPRFGTAEVVEEVINYTSNDEGLRGNFDTIAYEICDIGPDRLCSRAFLTFELAPAFPPEPPTE